jgi:hypothetical protein
MMTETINLAPALDAVLHGYDVPAYLWALGALAVAVLLAAIQSRPPGRD